MPDYTTYCEETTLEMPGVQMGTMGSRGQSMNSSTTDRLGSLYPSRLLNPKDAYSGLKMSEWVF